MSKSNIQSWFFLMRERCDQRENTTHVRTRDGVKDDVDAFVIASDLLRPLKPEHANSLLYSVVNDRVVRWNVLLGDQLDRFLCHHTSHQGRCSGQTSMS